MSEVAAGKLAAIWRKIGGEIDDLTKEYELKVAALKGDQDAIGELLLEKCKEENADSIKTPYGTIIRSVKTRFWPADWDVTKRYILEHEALDLFEKRLHQGNVKEWIESNPDDPIPGLNIDRKYAVSVRKAAK